MTGKLVRKMPLPGPGAAMRALTISCPSGRRVSTHTADGQELVLAVIGPGNTVGELAALDAGPHTATVVAIEPTVADHVGRDVFVDALGRSPQACLRLLRLMAGLEWEHPVPRERLRLPAEMR